MSNTQEYRGNHASDNARVHMGNIHGNQYNNNYNHTFYGHHKPKPPKDTDYARDLIEAAQAGSLKRTERCLKYDIDVSLTDEEGRTALHWAAIKGHENIARALIEAHCNIDAISKESRTPLCEAVVAAKGSIVQLLLEHGAAPNLADGEGRTPLHWAASEGHEEITQTLIDGHSDINATSTRHGTPLCQAAFAAKENTTRLLLEHGAEIDAACGRHGSALHAACFSGSLHIVNLLLGSGADVNTFRVRGELDRIISKDLGAYHFGRRLARRTELTQMACTPLHTALSRKRIGVVNSLLSAGANMEARFAASNRAFKPGSELWMELPSDFETTGMSWAGSAVHLASAFDPTILKMLIERGADVNAITGRTYMYSGIAPIHSAALAANAECLLVLLDHGAMVDLKSTSNIFDTALKIGAYHGHMDCVKLLLDHGARPDGPESDDYTPLTNAVFGGYQDIAELLLARGASVSLKNENGATALHYARSGECVRLLVRHGAHLDVKDPSSRTPLMFIIRWNYRDLTALETLLNLGASVHEVDDEGKNAYDYAMSEWDGLKKKQLLAMLKQHGAKPTSIVKRLVNR